MAGRSGATYAGVRIDFAPGLHILDGGGVNWKTLQVPRNPACPECAVSRTE